MKHVLAIALLTVVIAACSDDQSTSPTDSQAYLKATIDSVLFVGTDSTLAGARIGPSLSVGAANAAGQQLSIFLDTMRAGEIHYFGTGIANTSYAVYTKSSSPSGVYYAHTGGGAGEVRITALTSSEVSGTFKLTVVSVVDSVSQITNGSFRVRLE